MSMTSEVINWEVAEAITFVPGVRIEEETDGNDKVTARKLVKI